MTHAEILRHKGKTVGRVLSTTGAYGYRSRLVIPAVVLGVKGNRVLLQFQTSSGTTVERLCVFRNAVPANEITSGFECPREQRID